MIEATKSRGYTRKHTHTHNFTILEVIEDGLEITLPNVFIEMSITLTAFSLIRWFIFHTKGMNLEPYQPGFGT